MCPCRLQPTRDACAVPVQWFSSVVLVESFNPFKPNEIYHYYQLDQSIST